MMNPEIATILENGTYGQRPMTDEEYANYLEQRGEPRATEGTDETPSAD